MIDEARHPLMEETTNRPLDAVDELMAGVDISHGAVECKFRTGAAGTGKTYLFKQELERDPRAGILCATTGVAAVNLGTVTLNSVLKYFDTDSLRDQYATGRLQRSLMRLATEYRSLMIDEVSMMEKDQLDVIVQAAIEANGRQTKQLAITLTGDFCQLPPVNGEWAFYAHNWHRFAANTEKLERVYRQTDVDFLAALKLARQGQSRDAAESFRPLAKWTVAQLNDFPGTTIFSKNDDVDRFNNMRYMQLTGKELRFRSLRYGKLRSEWKNIPDAFTLKLGALVMVLTNAKVRPGEVLPFANGDQGHVVDFAPSGVWVQLIRTKQTHLIPFIIRKNDSKETPADAQLTMAEPPYLEDDGDGHKRWVYGTITYMPLRLAYAATVHKTQGLTLDNVQLDIRGHFFGSPNMAYVALSRVKTPAGLRIVGTPELLARRINISPEVLPWV